MKTLPTSLKEKKNQLASTDPWIYLFVVQVSDTEAYYLTSHSQEIIYSGETYKPFPIAVGDITEDSNGNLESVTLTVANIDRAMMAFMEQNDALLGRGVWIYIMNKSDLTQAIEIGVYQVTEAESDRQAATFVLGHYNFFGLKFPRNRYIRGRCRWVYKGGECLYAGGLPACDKTLNETNGCRAHNNTARFGGFPGIPAGRFITR